MTRHVLHLISSHVSNPYMYNQIVGVQGYKPVVYGGYVIDGFPFKRFVAKKNPSKDFKKILHKYPIDLLHAHFGGIGAQAVPFARKYGLPLVVHFRGGDGSNDPAVKDKLTAQYADLTKAGTMFLPVCEALVPMLQDLGFPKEKIKVLYGGINLHDFPFCTRDYDTYDKYRICFVGKTSPKKGIPVLIDAFARLTKHFDRLELLLISSSPRSKVDCKEFNKIQALIDEHNLRDQVFFRFNVNNRELYRELHQSHLFCHPSLTFDGNIEGIPNALKEAMATGLPCVSTFHAGIPELIRSGHNGLLVPENDPLALSDALGRLIANPSLCRIFAERGRQTVENQFDLVKQLAVQKQLYDSLWEMGD